MPAQKRHIALILLILAAALICGYRLYMGQETHAHLLTGTVDATRIDVSTKESGRMQPALLPHARQPTMHEGLRSLQRVRLRSKISMHCARRGTQRRQICAWLRSSRPSQSVAAA